MHHKNINYLDNISYYKNIGIRSYRLELFDEDYEETIKLIETLKLLNYECKMASRPNWSKNWYFK